MVSSPMGSLGGAEAVRALVGCKENSSGDVGAVPGNAPVWIVSIAVFGGRGLNRYGWLRRCARESMGEVLSAKGDTGWETLRPVFEPTHSCQMSCPASGTGGRSIPR